VVLPPLLDELLEPFSRLQLEASTSTGSTIAAAPIRRTLRLPDRPDSAGVGVAAALGRSAMVMCPLRVTLPWMVAVLLRVTRGANELVRLRRSPKPDRAGQFWTTV
jgi:hypothetical protein